MAFQNRLITFAPCCFLLLWSSGFIFLKMGLQHTDPFTFLALRYVCVGLFLQAGYFTFTYFSIRHEVSALLFLVPPTTALIAYYALDETLSQLAIVGMALAAGGIYLVMGRAVKKHTPILKR